MVEVKTPQVAPNTNPAIEAYQKLASDPFITKLRAERKAYGEKQQRELAQLEAEEKAKKAKENKEPRYGPMTGRGRVVNPRGLLDVLATVYEDPAINMFRQAYNASKGA